jgi:tRNA U55 pseudouridine synthase TruB
MILAVGKGTKNLTKFIGLDKEYVAEIDLSKESDTRDMEYRNEIKNHELKIKN